MAVKADTDDELTIYVDKKKVPLPHEFEFTEYFVACSDSFSMTYPHDPELNSPIFKINPDNFLEKGLPDVQFYIGSELVFTGYVEIPAYRIGQNQATQTLGGRSKTLLLEKSDFLPSIKREFIKLSLKQIAEIIAGAFGIPVSVQSGIKIGEVFAKATAEDNEKPFAFLARLAKQRQLLIGKTANGGLAIIKAVESDPVAFFDIDDTFLKFVGIDSLEFVFDTTDIYGSYIGKTKTATDPNVSATVPSGLLAQQSVKIIDFPEGQIGNIEEMTGWEEQKATIDFYKNSIPYPSWLNPKTGKRWKPGQFVALRSSAAMISEPVLMMIRSVKFTDSGKKVATLELVQESTYLDIPVMGRNKKGKKKKTSVIDKLGIQEFGAKK